MSRSEHFCRWGWNLFLTDHAGKMENDSALLLLHHLFHEVSSFWGAEINLLNNWAYKKIGIQMHWQIHSHALFLLCYTANSDELLQAITLTQREVSSKFIGEESWLSIDTGWRRKCKESASPLLTPSWMLWKGCDQLVHVRTSPVLVRWRHNEKNGRSISHSDRAVHFSLALQKTAEQ